MNALRALLGLAIGASAACSLLAPSDEEATRGLGRPESPTTAPPDASTAPDVAAPSGPAPRVCPGCERACNAGQCASCYHNGEQCSRDDDCCEGSCNAGTCAATSGACKSRGDDCGAGRGSCCAGLTCSVERDNRCEACSNAGGECKADGDCCSARCAGTSCAACIPKGTSGCTSNRQCCGGRCDAGTCG